MPQRNPPRNLPPRRATPEDLCSFLLEQQGADRVLLLLDREGSIQDARGRVEQILRVAPSDLEGRACATLLSAADVKRGAAERMLRDALAKRIEQRRWCVRADGERFWAETTLAAIRDDGGNEVGYVFAIRDLTELKRAEEAAKRLSRAVEERKESERLQDDIIHALEGITNALLVLDRDWRLLFANPRAAQLIRKPREALVGCNLWDELHMPDGANFRRQLEKAVEERVPVQFEEFYPLLNTWYEVHAFPFDGGLVLYFWDISLRKLETARLQHLAFHDAATGLPNRALFLDRLEQAVTLAERNRKHSALLLLSIDPLADVSTSFGHSVAELMVGSVAAELKQVIRKTDTLARLGDELFAVITADHPRSDGPGVLAEKLVSTAARVIPLGRKNARTTLSVGVAVFPDDATDADELVRCCEAALARSREAGGNTFRFYSPELQQEVERRKELEEDLRASLSNAQFDIVFVPEVDLKSSALVGVEALLRWKQPNNEIVAAGQFLPNIRSSELLRALDEWVLRSACAQRVQWLDTGLGGFPVTVNVSATLLQDPRLPRLIDDVLDETGLPPRLLELEFTEAAVGALGERAPAILQPLRDRGIRLSLDDLGSGALSVATIDAIPVGKHKLHASVVRSVDGEAETAAASAAISLTHALSRRVVAKGVTTARQLEALRQRGCDAAQGPAISQLLGREAVAEFATAADL